MKKSCEKVISVLLSTFMILTFMGSSTFVKKNDFIVQAENIMLKAGDINGDGKINITDMIAVKAHVLKKSILSGVYANAGDVNGDGKVNITDFIKIKANLLGKDTILGVPIY